MLCYGLYAGVAIACMYNVYQSKQKRSNERHYALLDQLRKVEHDLFNLANAKMARETAKS